MNMEQIASFLVSSIFAVPVIIIGVVLCCGKGAFLIAGYNTAVLDITVLMWDGGILMAVSTVFGLIYVNKSQRFKRK